MASGCTTSGSTASSVLFQKLTPDTQVQYTGIPYPQFGICTGDLLSEVEASILGQLVGFAAGQGITLSEIDLTECACFVEKVGCCGKESCQTLECILQAYLECMCELYGDVQTLKTTVSAMYDGPYDTKCLTGVTSASKLPAIISAITGDLCTTITNLANLTTTVNNLSSGLGTTIGNFLKAAIVSCQSDSVVKTGTGASVQITLKGLCPIGTIQMYGGPVAGVFDGTGMGITGGPACGWALCNGAVQNGIATVDMRGYFPVGVNNGSMGGGSQNPEVDDAINPGQTYGLNAHGGEIKHLLSSAEMPAVGFSGSTASASGSLGYYKVSRKSANTGDNTMGYMCDGSGTSTPCPSAPNGSINFTVPGQTFSGSIGGGGQKHENRPPYRALYFIQRVA